MNEIETLKAEVERLTKERDALYKKLSGDFEDVELVYKDGLLNLKASHPITAYIASELCSLFKGVGAINYVSLDVCPKDESIGPLELIIQRREGKTPAQLNMELMKKLAALRQEAGKGER